MSRKKIILTASVVLVAGLLTWYWLGRRPAEADEAGDGGANNVTAPVIRVARRDMGDVLSISGAFKAFQDVDIHAKVAGYVKAIYVDVGDRPKQGQTLAILEVPELEAQLTGANAAVQAAQEQVRRAQGDLERAQATHSAAHSAYVRLKQASDSRAGLVAQQEVDDWQAKDLSSQAQVASAEAGLSGAKQQLEVAQANQKQYTALTEYTRITAPFDGVVTIRYADTGTLLAAGTSESTQSTPLVRLAQTSILRLVLPIPESLASDIRVGRAMKVHVEALDQDFEGKVARYADSLDEQTRTMHTEIDFQNRDNKLMPGMYAEMYFSHNQRKNVLTIPLEAVKRDGDKASVLKVNSENVIEERPITLGQQGNANVEVVSGLKEGDFVIDGNLGEFRPGEKISPKEIQSAPSNGAEGQ